MRQSLDYSCGAAALATILTHYYGAAVTERALLGDLLKKREEQADKGGKEGKEAKDGKEWKEEQAGASASRSPGLSFDDLAMLARDRGFLALGVSAQYADLARLRHPAIVALDLEGRQHFSVLRRAGANSVALADASWGNRNMHAATFRQYFLHDAAGTRGRLLLILEKTGARGDETFMLAARPGALVVPGLLQRPH